MSQYEIDRENEAVGPDYCPVCLYNRCECEDIDPQVAADLRDLLADFNNHSGKSSVSPSGTKDRGGAA